MDSKTSIRKIRRPSCSRFHGLQKICNEKDFIEVAQLNKETKEYTDKGLLDRKIKTINIKIRHTVLTWIPVNSDTVDGYRICRSTEEYDTYKRCEG